MSLRIKLACKIISMGVAILPEDFRNKRMIANLMSTGHVKAISSHCDCADPQRRWEPCGELGHSEAHVKVSEEP